MGLAEGCEQDAFVPRIRVAGWPETAWIVRQVTIQPANGEAAAQFN